MSETLEAVKNEDVELYSLGAAFNGAEIVSILEARIPIIDMGFLILMTRAIWRNTSRHSTRLPWTSSGLLIRKSRRSGPT